MPDKTADNQSGGGALPERAGATGRVAEIDAWMASHPWNPRVAPYMLYVLLLWPVRWAHDLEPGLYPLAYSLQCGLVAWVLWRYRKLTPELTVRFHWLALPVGIGVAAVWIALGLVMVRLHGQWIGGAVPKWFAQSGPTPFFDDDQMGPVVGWTAMALRLAGMSIVVPLFEELCMRSLLLRSLHRMRMTAFALVQLAENLPLIGDWLVKTRLSDRAAEHRDILAGQFNRTPLGALSVFGVIASTFVFMLFHLPRDWPAIWVCGIAYCLLLWVTRHKGLGPVIWAHGITNAILWGYTVWTGDWQFL